MGDQQHTAERQKNTMAGIFGRAIENDNFINAKCHRMSCGELINCILWQRRGDAEVFRVPRLEVMKMIDLDAFPCFKCLDAEVVHH